MTKSPRLLAERISKALFTNGVGSVADRLVLVGERSMDLGGWCRGAAADVIEKEILSYLTKTLGL